MRVIVDLGNEASIENVYNCILEDGEFGVIPQENMRILTKEAVAELCDKVWGIELTESEAHRIIKELLDI